MDQKNLSKWLKGIIIGTGVCGLIVYGIIIPSCGAAMKTRYPEFSHCFVPWLVFLLCTAVPCYTALIFAWKISGNIGRDRSFCMENAALLKKIALLAAGDAGFFFLGNLVLLFLSMSHPGIALLSLLAVFAGTAIAAAAAALSHQMRKAALMQEEIDLTI